ncbi:hypothetical protein VP01_3465g1 [Puccinia sorghi]|uniref:Uncharacterized protein n=1 Tax=Puccinia sorghi TaxID=27349 RepID=A0A0L6UW30_9BASI|nr:hypothetical protein VP01_3465g1 [Puccinia sorghi]
MICLPGWFSLFSNPYCFYSVFIEKIYLEKPYIVGHVIYLRIIILFCPNYILASKSSVNPITWKIRGAEALVGFPKNISSTPRVWWCLTFLCYRLNSWDFNSSANIADKEAKLQKNTGKIKCCSLKKTLIAENMEYIQHLPMHHSCNSAIQYIRFNSFLLPVWCFHIQLLQVILQNLQILGGSLAVEPIHFNHSNYEDLKNTDFTQLYKGHKCVIHHSLFSRETPSITKTTYFILGGQMREEDCRCRSEPDDSENIFGGENYTKSDTDYPGATIFDSFSPTTCASCVWFPFRIVTFSLAPPSEHTGLSLLTSKSLQNWMRCTSQTPTLHTLIAIIPSSCLTPEGDKTLDMDPVAMLEHSKFTSRREKTHPSNRSIYHVYIAIPPVFKIPENTRHIHIHHFVVSSLWRVLEFRGNNVGGRWQEAETRGVASFRTTGNYEGLGQSYAWSYTQSMTDKYEDETDELLRWGAGEEKKNGWGNRILARGGSLFYIALLLLTLTLKYNSLHPASPFIKNSSKGSWMHSCMDKPHSCTYNSVKFIFLLHCLWVGLRTLGHSPHIPHDSICIYTSIVHDLSMNATPAESVQRIVGSVLLTQQVNVFQCQNAVHTGMLTPVLLRLLNPIHKASTSLYQLMLHPLKNVTSGLVYHSLWTTWVSLVWSSPFSMLNSARNCPNHQFQTKQSRGHLYVSLCHVFVSYHTLLYRKVVAAGLRSSCRGRHGICGNLRQTKVNKLKYLQEFCLAEWVEFCFCQPE